MGKAQGQRVTVQGHGARQMAKHTLRVILVADRSDKMVVQRILSKNVRNVGQFYQ